MKNPKLNRLEHTNLSAQAKHFLVATLLFFGLSLLSSKASAGIITLDFKPTTGNPADYYISLDTSTIANVANTDAYNNISNYTETVNTTVNNGVTNQSPGTVYATGSATINQIYSQTQGPLGINSQMSLSLTFQANTSVQQIFSPSTYTGNLPASLIPSPSNQANTYLQDYISINSPGNFAIGSTPAFVVYDDAQLTNLFSKLIGSTFSFNDSKSLYTYSVSRYFCESLFRGIPAPISGKNYATAIASGGPDSSSSPRSDPTRGSEHRLQMT